MDLLLRTLTRRNSSPNRGGRNRTRREEQGGNKQFELILETLARGLVEYAVRKYMPGHGNDRSRDRDRDRDGRHDDRLRTRDHRDDDQRHRGGVPNMDNDMLEHLGKTILGKAIEKFGGGGEEEMRASGGGGRGRERGRGGSLDRYDHSRERSRERSRDRRGYDRGGERGRRGRDGHGEDYRRGGSPEAPRSHREDEQRRRRRRHGGTDYAPLKTELEALSNALISLNERQPGHPDCEFYDAFVDRSGKVQSAIGSVMVQIQEREERREARRGRRRD